jgi:hypothetical protein
MGELISWHRLFGLSWVNHLMGFPAEIELEKDLSLKQQLLDVVIIHTDSTPLACPMPDGFENLTRHNLITFKSFQDSLDSFTLKELVGHGVNYRKQVSPSFKELLPETDFRLFAVSVRYPQGLAANVRFVPVSDGVYDIPFFDDSIRLVVVRQLAKKPNNALLHLLSANEELVKYGQATYPRDNPETSTLFQQLWERYAQENDFMAETLQQFHERVVAEVMKKASIEQRLEGIPTEKRLEGIPTEKRLEGIPTEKRLEGIPTEELIERIPTQEFLKNRSVADVLASLSEAEREAFKRALLEGDSSAEPKPGS